MSFWLYSLTSDCRRQQRAVGGIREVVAHAQQIAVGRRQLLRAAREDESADRGQPSDDRAAARDELGVFMSFPHGHGADLPSESRLDDHHDVHEHEQHERNECEEVDGARGLDSRRTGSAATETPPSPPATSSGRSARSAARPRTPRTSTRISAARRSCGPPRGGRNAQAQVIDDVAPDETRRELLRARARCASGSDRRRSRPGGTRRRAAPGTTRPGSAGSVPSRSD